MEKKLTKQSKGSHQESAMAANLLPDCREDYWLDQCQGVNLNDLIAKHVDKIQSLVGERITIVLVLEPDLPTVRGRPSEILQVLLNLAVEAGAAMGEAGQLTVETALVSAQKSNGEQAAGRKTCETFGPSWVAGTRWEESQSLPAAWPPSSKTWVALIIRDTGCVTAAQLKTRLSSPFFSAAPEQSGAGLSMVNVANLIQNQGGQAWVECSSQQGNSVTISLQALR